MKRIKTDLSKLDELIARQYEDKIRGFVKDTLQNSWEARINRKKGTDFRMVYQFYDDLDGIKNILMLEDSGTIGMDDKRWEAFHYHWKTTKGASYDGGIGRWGQGKTLLLYFSSKNTIITESIDRKTNKYRYSVRTNEGYLELGDRIGPSDPAEFKGKSGLLKTIDEFFPSIQPLNHHGTRIWILNVKEDLAEEIRKGELLINLMESWWEIIRNYGVEINVIVNSKIESVQLTQFPDTQDRVDEHNLAVNREHGRIKRLKIVLAKKAIKPSLQGIAIQRGGMTVLRYSLPSSAPDELRERCYGYCQLDQELDEEMWEIELANHEGFESRKAVWVKLRRCIDSVAESFIIKHSKGKEEEKLPFDLDDIIKTVNKLVDEHLEGLGSGGPRPIGPRKTPTPPPPICISPWGYEGDDKRFDKEDMLQPKCALCNKTDSDAHVIFKTWIESKDGATYWGYKIDHVKIEKKSKSLPKIPDIELSKLSLMKGVYHLNATIIDNKKEILHSRSATFYYEQDPPAMGGWLKKIIWAPIGGQHKNHRNLPINKNAVLLINTAYPEIRRIWRSEKLANKAKANELTPIFINTALHEATREVLLNWWGASNFDIDEIKRAKDIFDEMWADYIRVR